MPTPPAIALYYAMLPAAADACLRRRRHCLRCFFAAATIICHRQRRHAAADMPMPRHAMMMPPRLTIP